MHLKVQLKHSVYKGVSSILKSLLARDSNWFTPKINECQITELTLSDFWTDFLIDKYRYSIFSRISLSFSTDSLIDI